MTKKAAKKKQSTKRSTTKPAGSGAETETKVGEAPSGAEAAPEPKEARSPQEIPMVQETASPEMSSPPRKMGRVPRPDGGKRTESSRQRSGSARRGNNRRGGGPRPAVDNEELGQKAWKIFQHEIAEEGLALIDETSARQLAEKSVLVARAFLEERERRLGRDRPSEENAESKAGGEPSARENSAPSTGEESG